MALPETIAVKISSEAAGYVSLTPVVNQQMRVRELVELMMGVTGPDAERIRELLKRGSIVSGASRFRWAGFEAEPSDLNALLAGMPASDPARAFAPDACTRAVLRGPGVRIEITREAAQQRRLFKRKSFWDVLTAASREHPPAYVEYSYGERADRYSSALSPETAARLSAGAALLRYAGLEAQVRRAAIDTIEFLAPR